MSSIKLDDLQDIIVKNVQHIILRAPNFVRKMELK